METRFKRYLTLIMNMKRIFFYLIALVPYTTFAQTNDQFSITCSIGKLNSPSRAYLVYQLGANRIVDSAEIVSGNFKFTGQVIYPTNAFLIMDRTGIGFTNLDKTADILNFYLEKGEFTIKSADSASKAQITGSKINDDYKKLMSQLNPFFDETQKIEADDKSTSEATKNTEAYQTDLDKKRNEIQVGQKAVLKLFILANPDSYLSLLALSSIGGPSPDPVELTVLYNSLSQRIKDTETAKNLKIALDKLNITGVGAMAPDFTEADVNGQPIKLSSFRGKYVLIDFWASWCGPCRQENPNVVKAFNKYKDKNFTVLGVSLDRETGKEDWINAIKNDGLSWTQVSDLKFWKSEAAVLYDVSAIPANFLIDPDGKIIAKNLRGRDLEHKLEELLGK
jgi:peroxiredoxin